MNRRSFIARVVGAVVAAPIAAAVAQEAPVLGIRRSAPMPFTINFPDSPMPWICSGWVHKSDEGVPISAELGELIEKLEEDRRTSPPWEIKLF